ncbi:MAG: PIN domain-containing protein [Dehalococcoidia bacterium]|nr:PIN domain-containing protein [Dehalococcoidia bacterium]
MTTRYVIVETYGGLIRTVGAREARAFLRTGLEEIAVEPVSDADLKRAEMILYQYEDKDYSDCDALSFAVMERLHLRLAFAFDGHFRQHGYSTPPDRQDWP